MRDPLLKTIALSWFVAALVVGCSKKESASPSAPASALAGADLPKDGVSSVPAPAERAADLSAVDLTIAGAVKEIKAKVLDKEADDKAKGLLRVKALDLDGPIDVSDNTQWEVWKPGSDIEEQKPELTFWASNEQPLSEGTWDLRLRYQEGQVCKAEGWIRGVKVEPGKLWKAEAVIGVPMEYVRVYGTLGGKDLADNVKIDVFKAGTDQEEFQPIASFWSTQKQPMAAGSYDLRLQYDKDNVKAKADLKAFAVGGDHGILKKTVALAKM